MEESKIEKRLDLQGIRGIAILSVLGFHFLPDRIPNGYVGVDQFFVLSGFLMCMLLRKSYSNPNSFQWILNFYTRRLKRIVPLYFLLIFLALLSIYTVFPWTAIDTNVHSGRKALVFMSNRVETANEDYFEMLSIAIDVFTHTWSLSVEVQFYLLIPFLYLIGAKLGQYSENFEIRYHVMIGISSFIYSTWFCTQTEAFHSIFARIWQFSIGILAYLIFDLRDMEAQEKYSRLPGRAETTVSTVQHYFKNLLIILLIFGVIYPMELPNVVFRPFMTLLTGIMLILSSGTSNFILESRFLTYSGDISYSLYLIHWPIYAYYKLEYGHLETFYMRSILAFGLSILLAMMSYEYFEKWYLKQSNSTVFLISSILFSLNLGLLYQNDVTNWIYPPPTSSRLDGLLDGEIVSYYKAEKLNRQWSIEDYPNLDAPTCEYEGEHDYGIGLCRHTGLDKKNGSFKMMLIGNSYAANHGRLFYEECGNKSTSITQLSLTGCEPLYPFGKQTDQCRKEFDSFEKEVEKKKPDYLFIFARFMGVGAPMPFNVTSLDDDPVYQKMKSQLEIYSKNVKNKVLMMQQIAKIDDRKVDQIAKTVFEKRNLVDFDKSLIAAFPEMARSRYEKLATECSKCALFDYEPYFYNKTTYTWRFYDESNAGLSYLTSGGHFTFHGLELIRPVISDLCRKL